MRARGLMAWLVAVGSVGCAAILGVNPGNPDEVIPLPDGGLVGPDGAPAPDPSCPENTLTSVTSCGACNRRCETRSNSIPECKVGVCGLVCNIGAGDCDGDPANGCETPTSNNGAHCARCGRDCLGAPCTDGRCGAVTIVSGQAFLDKVTANADTLVWTLRGDGDLIGPEVRKCDLANCGGTIKQNIVNAIFEDTPVVLDTTTLYYVRGADFGRCPIATCPAGNVNQMRDMGGANHGPLLLDGTTLFSTNLVSSVHRVDTDGNGGVTIYTGPNNQFRPELIGVGTNDVVFWSKQAQTLFACPRAGCIGPPTAVKSGVPSALSLLVVNTTMFWSDATNAVFSCPIANCQTPMTMAVTPAGATGLTTDGTEIYWTANGTIAACTIGGCGGAPRTVVTGEPPIKSLFIHGKFIYFTIEGSVRRVVK